MTKTKAEFEQGVREGWWTADGEPICIDNFDDEPKAMTPDEFRAIRKSLGLTQAQLAQRLGYSHATRVAEFEGGHAIPPLLERLMRAYEAGYRPKDWAA